MGRVPYLRSTAIFSNSFKDSSTLSLILSTNVDIILTLLRCCFLRNRHYFEVVEVLEVAHEYFNLVYWVVDIRVVLQMRHQTRLAANHFFVNWSYFFKLLRAHSAVRRWFFKFRGWEPWLHFLTHFFCFLLRIFFFLLLCYFSLHLLVPWILSRFYRWLSSSFLEISLECANGCIARWWIWRVRSVIERGWTVQESGLLSALRDITLGQSSLELSAGDELSRVFCIKLSLNPVKEFLSMRSDLCACSCAKKSFHLFPVPAVKLES